MKFKLDDQFFGGRGGESGLSGVSGSTGSSNSSGTSKASTSGGSSGGVAQVRSLPTSMKKRLTNPYTQYRDAINKSGLEVVTESSVQNLKLGDSVVVSTIEMNSRMSNHRDPDAVNFDVGKITFIGKGMSPAVSVMTSSGRKIVTNIGDYPYEDVFFKRK